MNYYDWGNNCRVLGFSRDDAEDCICADERAAASDHDEFWTGYLYGESGRIVPIYMQMTSCS